jgi:regulator of sigma E protease
MIHYLEVAVVFLTILSVLVAIHEFGHYLFARAFKMGVEEFSIGMFGRKPLLVFLKRKYRIQLQPGENPRLDPRPEGFSLESGNQRIEPVLVETESGPILEETTLFTVRPWPIGGFVRIKGMLASDDGSEVNVPGGFYNKPPWQRFIVLLAGPTFSVLAGVLLLIPIFFTGVTYRPDSAPILGTVTEGAAAKAGLLTYDRILSINSHPIDNFYQIITNVQGSGGLPLKVEYERNGKKFHTTVVPVLSSEPKPVLGPDLEWTGELSRRALISVAPIEDKVHLSLLAATMSAVKLPIITVKGLIGIVKKPSTAKSEVGGPGTMISATSDAVNEGWQDVFSVAAMISISVGIFNLLPVHPLDGGQMVVALAEILRGGRRLSFRVQNVFGAMGLATVLLLVVCALSLDFGRFRSGSPPDPKIVSQQKD